MLNVNTESSIADFFDFNLPFAILLHGFSDGFPGDDEIDGEG